MSLSILFFCYSCTDLKTFPSWILSFALNKSPYCISEAPWYFYASISISNSIRVFLELAERYSNSTPAHLRCDRSVDKKVQEARGFEWNFTKVKPNYFAFSWNKYKALLFALMGHWFLWTLVRCLTGKKNSTLRQVIKMTLFLYSQQMLALTKKNLFFEWLAPIGLAGQKVFFFSLSNSNRHLRSHLSELDSSSN